MEVLADLMQLDDVDREFLCSVNSVPFKVHKMEEGKTLWINGSVFSPEDPFREGRFLDEYCLGIRACETFQGIRFSDSESRTLIAERYGGYCVGRNGGGARCGNINGVQIKGIGPNPLVGAGQDRWHSYGGLNAVDAIYEVVASNLVNSVLPVGAATCYGVILVGEESAYGYNNTVEPGALLLRELCVRPAHLLKSPFYKQPSAGKSITEKYRIKVLVKTLVNDQLSAKNFVSVLARFTKNSAVQMAASRVLRLCHGSMNASNLSIDGRWLDLTNVSFLPPRMNSGGEFPFLSERDAVSDIIKDVVYTVQKYSDIDLNPDPLVNYYKEIYRSSYQKFLIKFLGLHPVKCDVGALKSIEIYAESFVYGDSQPTDVWPESMPERDPMAMFVIYLYSRSLNVRDSDHFLPFNDKETVGLLDSAANEFLSISYDSYMSSELKCSYEQFLHASLVRCLSCIYNSALFYKGALEKNIRRIIENREYNEVASLIESYSRLSDSIWPDDGDLIIISGTGGWSLKFESELIRYFLVSEGLPSLESKSLGSLVEALKENEGYETDSVLGSGCLRVVEKVLCCLRRLDLGN